MIKKALVAIAILAGTASAQADGYFPRHGHGHHHQHFRHNNGGGDAGAALIGGLIGGMILNQMMQPPRYGYYQPMCQTVFLGRVWNGYTWVEQYQRICD